MDLRQALRELVRKVTGAAAFLCLIVAALTVAALAVGAASCGLAVWVLFKVRWPAALVASALVLAWGMQG